MSDARDVVIAAAVRTPIGKFLGGFSSLAATDLGTISVRAALERAGVDAAAGLVDEVIMGQVVQAGAGQNPARQAALNAGLPDTTPAFTVNKVCGSSLKAVMLAASAIKAGDADVVVAGGMESMTNAPHLVKGARQGIGYGSRTLVDSLQHDGLTDAFSGLIMGNTGEVVAREFGISRKEADAFAAASHRKAARATDDGAFRDEIVPVEVKGRRGHVTVIDRDEGIRADTSEERLARLKPAFDQEGVVTAGNASQLSDGAACTVVASRGAAEEHGLPILATVEAYNTVGVEPERVMAAPIDGVKKLLRDTGLDVTDVDLYEHNEAFATASCAVAAECAIPEGQFNVHGGAVALGHPLGASGARVLTTLLYAMKRQQKETGVATLCLGGGNAVTMLVKRG